MLKNSCDKSGQTVGTLSRCSFAGIPKMLWKETAGSQLTGYWRVRTRLSGAGQNATCSLTQLRKLRFRPFFHPFTCKEKRAGGLSSRRAIYIDDITTTKSTLRT